MGKIKSFVNYFTVFERCLWLSSIALITVSFMLFDRSSYLSLVASLIGVTALIFCAKGNPTGQALMIVFALIYGYISFTLQGRAFGVNHFWRDGDGRNVVTVNQKNLRLVRSEHPEFLETFFDMKTNKTLTWNGSHWVDAMGDICDDVD